MKDSQGYIVEYATKNGKMQRAVALHREQTKIFKDSARAFLRLIDIDGNYIENKDGKKIISVKQISELTIIGFQD